MGRNRCPGWGKQQKLQEVTQSCVEPFQHLLKARTRDHQQRHHLVLVTNRLHPHQVRVIDKSTRWLVCTLKVKGRDAETIWERPGLKCAVLPSPKEKEKKVGPEEDLESGLHTDGPAVPSTPSCSSDVCAFSRVQNSQPNLHKEASGNGACGHSYSSDT